jgi:glycosyltransferase involved in cell wall biosynthesis/1-acyl-sn-glycerol-3-phosphate acyltransferase
VVIVFVEDNFKNLTDGTSVSAHRFRGELIKRGHTVRVLAMDVSGEDMYSLREHRLPIVSAVARRNSMYFAKYDEKVVRRALEGADIVHLFFPWDFERRCAALARKMGIPVCGAFHCQPENVTYNMMIKFLEPANTLIYFLFKTWLYRKLDNIHCPSLFTARELRKHKYDARLHVISNGVSDAFRPPASPVAKKDDKIRILMIGRLAEEKRQDLIIKAVGISKYSDRIELFFAGQGPMKKRYIRYSRKLPNKPHFEFLPQDQLLEIIHKTDIYIHASDAEIEGISCLEAVSCGKVPIISDSEKSAASQFALDERSLFKKGNYRDLRTKIEYWIEHPAERERMEAEYAKLGEKYHISRSIDKIEKMFDAAVKDHRTEKMIRDDAGLRKYYHRVRGGNKIKEFFGALFYFAIALNFFHIISRIFFGLRIKNGKVLKKLKKTGALTVCNHPNGMDFAVCASAIPRRRLIFVRSPSSSPGAAGFFAKILGSVPVPAGPRETRVFLHALSKRLRQRRLVHFFPEGELKRGDPELRGFYRGAFCLATDAQAPVLPMRIIPRESGGFLRFFRRKPCFTLVFGEPVYPDPLLLPEASAEDIERRVREIMISLQ